MKIFIKTKFKISYDQTNIYKYRLAGKITEFSKGFDSTQHCPPFSRITIAEWCVVSDCTLRSGRNYAFIKNAKIVMLKMDVRTSQY